MSLSQLFEKYALELNTIEQYRQLTRDLSIEKDKLQKEFNDIKFQIEQMKYSKKNLDEYILKIKTL